jgi:hypothetical protein
MSGVIFALKFATVDFMPQELRPRARDVMASGTMDFITMSQ